MIRQRRVKLTDRMKRFCQLYVDNGGNGTKAYNEVYGEKSGARTLAYRMLQKVHIVNHLATLTRDMEEKTAVRAEITKDYVRKELQLALDKAKDINDMTAWLRALDLIGKSVGLYIDVSEVTDTVKQADIDADELEELRTIAAIRIAQGVA